MVTKPNYEVRVGLFTLIALGLLIWGWAWLKSASIFHPPQKFIARFHDVAGLNKNATVNINGVRVGVVEDIKLVNQQEVNVHLKITSENVRVPVGSTITIQTLGLVGAKYLEITLPKVRPGDQPPPQIAEGAVVDAVDPVRIELAINDVASRVQKVVRKITDGKNGASLENALEHTGAAMQNLQQASAKLNNNIEKFTSAADSVNLTSKKIGRVAESAGTFFDNTTDLTADLRITASRVNKILDKPDLTKDLKETVAMARETAATASAAIQQLNATLGDKDTRTDVITMLQKLTDSTENINKSMQIVNKLADDQGLRADLKEAVAGARDAMTKADEMMKDPAFKTDLTQTMTKVRNAATNIDLAARQINQILGKRAPLFHMMIGRPGRIKEEKVEEQIQELQEQQEKHATVDTKPAE